MEKDAIAKVFEKYRRAIIQYKIKPNRTYNMNKTGMRLGVRRGQWTIMPVDDKFSRFHHNLPTSDLTEHLTVIKIICGDDTAITPIVITKRTLIQA